MEKGKLPLTEFITLEGNKDQWNLLRNGLTNEIKFSGTILVSNEKTVRVRLHIIAIQHSDKAYWKGKIHVKTNLGSANTLAAERIFNFITDHIIKKDHWTFFGYIEGQNRIPIIIDYYESIDLAVYTQKTEDQEITEFFPIGIDPKLN